MFPQKRNSWVQSFEHIINPLLTELVRSRWLDIGVVRVKSAILTSRSVNNTYVSVMSLLAMFPNYLARFLEGV